MCVMCRRGLLRAGDAMIWLRRGMMINGIRLDRWQAQDVFFEARRLARAEGRLRRWPVVLLAVGLAVPVVLLLGPLILLFMPLGADFESAVVLGLLIGSAISLVLGPASVLSLRLFNHRELRRAMRIVGIPMCSACGFSLQGLPHEVSRCPECGAVCEAAPGGTVSRWWLQFSHIPAELSLTRERRTSVQQRAKLLRKEEPHFRHAHRRYLRLSWPLGGILSFAALPAMIFLDHAAWLLLMLAGFAADAYARFRTSAPFIRRVLHEEGYEICIDCGYLLRGLGDEVRCCPECGAERDPELMRIAQENAPPVSTRGASVSHSDGSRNTW